MSTPKLSNRQIETLEAIEIINQLFSTEAGLTDVSEFMTNIASTETQLGHLQSPVSYSPFQIDPIGYFDIVQKANAGEGQTIQRATILNELLRNLGYGNNFDVLSLSSDLDKLRDPLIGAGLARMILATKKEIIPNDIDGQAEYWKKHWNTTAGTGTPEHFKKESKYFNDIIDQIIAGTP